MRVSTPLLSQVGHHVDSRVRRYRGVFYWPAYKLYRRWRLEQNYQIPADTPLVVFDFSHTRIDGPQGRRFYALFIYFIRAGYYPVLKDSYLFLANINKRHKAYCLEHRFSLIKSLSDLKRPYVLVTDRTYKKTEPQLASKVVTIDYRPGYSESDKCFPMPFPMFSGIYRNGQDLMVDQLRHAPRQWQILFGGDAATKKYSQATIADVYSKIPRAEVLDVLRTELDGGAIKEPLAQAELDCLKGESHRGLVIINTRHCQIDTADWLTTIAKARFFLACPGVRYPMSHNAIEALAVGSVPIIQYPELFYPPLEHNVNCLVYKNKQELVDVLKRAMNMSPEDAATLSIGAAAYYDQFLEPKRVVQRLLAYNPENVNLRLLPFLKKGGGFA